jgi:hypothetical protein
VNETGKPSHSHSATILQTYCKPIRSLRSKLYFLLTEVTVGAIAGAPLSAFFFFFSLFFGLLSPMTSSLDLLNKMDLDVAAAGTQAKFSPPG